MLFRSVPSNDKWFRNLFVSKVIVGALKSCKLKTPKPDYDVKEMAKLFAKEMK